MTLRSFCLVLSLFAFRVPTVGADSLMEFQVVDGKKSALQSVLIKNGLLLVKSAGGDGNLDVLYERETDRLVLIDHKKHRFTPVTEQRVGQLAGQAEDIKPMVRGLSEQLAKLSPKQKAKWEDMLGGVSLDELGRMGRAPKGVRITKTGSVKAVAGVSCQPMSVIQGKATTAEFCLADPADLKLPEDDNATLRSLTALTQRVAAKAQGLAGFFGIAVPGDSIAELHGVPVELRDLSGKRPMVMTLNRVSGENLAGDPMKVPEGYQPQELTLWR